METQATILHADLDAFYASVEQLLDPGLRGKPIAVGGGVVLAASYEAKAFGVHGGMSGRKARELCPELVFVGGHFGEYQRLGDAAIAILGDFTPLVERISIDEAFADVAGCTHLFGTPAEIAATIRRRVRTELGLPISVGVARTKHLAKIASQVAKPDGLVVVDPATELAFLHDLPVDIMWGVGPVTRAKLADRGIFTIGELAATPGRALETLIGRAVGEKLGALAGTAIRARSVRIRGRGPPAPSPRSDGSPPSSGSSGPPSVTSPTGSPRASAPRRSPAGRSPCASASPTCTRSRGRGRSRRRSPRRRSSPRSPRIWSARRSPTTGRRPSSRSSPSPSPTSASSRRCSSSSRSASPTRSAAPAPARASRAGRPTGRWTPSRQRFGRDAVGYAAVALERKRSVPDAFRELAEKDLGKHEG